MRYEPITRRPFQKKNEGARKSFEVAVDISSYCYFSR